MVDLPEAERPVSQIVRPRWLRRSLRSVRVRAEAWKVMFLAVLLIVVFCWWGCEGGRGGVRRNW
jgi:hypothetical protein